MELIPVQEISRYSIVLNKNIESGLTWGKTPLSVITDKGLNFLDFSSDVKCIEKKIDVVESQITCPKTSPASKLFTLEMTASPISNINYTQMLIDPTLWPHSHELMAEMASFISFEWSPPEFLFHNTSIVATLTNMGNMEFFVKRRLGWQSILCLSNSIDQHYDLKPSETCRATNASLLEIKQGVQKLQTCAICWGPAADNSSCYFVTAQKNGDLLFWSISTEETELNAKYITTVSIDKSAVTTMKWINFKDQKFLLIYCNILGQLNTVLCEFSNGTIKLIKTNTLWNHEDRMVAKYITHTTVSDKLVILYTKHRHLVVQVLDDDQTVVSETFKNINDNRITSLQQKGHTFLLSTVNFKIYKVNISLSAQNISVDLSTFPINDSNYYPVYDLDGFDMSNNGVMCALAMSDKRVASRKENLTVTIAFLCLDINQMSQIALYKNCINLKHYWDYIELIRYYAVKLRMLPDIDLDKMCAPSKTHLFRLKFYLILLQLYTNLEENWIAPKVTFPVTSIEEIKETIMYMQAQITVESLLTKYDKNNCKLERLDEETLVSAKMYLEYYCRKYKCNLGDIADISKLNRVSSDIILSCETCDQPLEGFVCKEGHANMFCSVTFTPIVSDDYLFCKRCNATARSELYSLKPKCIFCDFHLQKF
ncbi:hypothetical protein JYU34_011945 [Plutella xylostella]|uniref:Transcription factor IIIC 90kDa subunit N-terminal domain-containing protein n=1 Tax=Plutella xylostella TaxID=51655 RepID=A0ABQ7QDZ6_PLUXY|nr:hypothetical protein JYU34_011945 [Plutella xylostella]